MQIIRLDKLNMACKVEATKLARALSSGASVLSNFLYLKSVFNQSAGNG